MPRRSRRSLWEADAAGSGPRRGRRAARGNQRARVVARGDISWAGLDHPAGRRPVCILTRDAAIAVLTAVSCAPITRTIRGIRSEVEVGPEHGLPDTSVIVCDNIITIPQAQLDPEPVGHLDEVHIAALDRALRYALDIRY